MKLTIAVYLLTLLFSVKADAGADLRALEKEFYAWKQRENPEFTTSTGVHKYDDLADDFSLNSLEAQKNTVGRFILRLQRINQTDLTRKEGYSYEVFIDTMKMFYDNYKWRNYGALNPVNFLEGDQIDPQYMLSIMLFNNKGDLENYIARLNALPVKMRQYIERFKVAMHVGNTYHKVSVDRVPGQISRLLVDKTEDSVYYKPFKDSVDKLQIPDSEKADLRARGRSAVVGLMDGFRELKAFLDDDYLNHTREKFGVWGLNQGLEYYKACLEWHLSVAYTPAEVHKIGLAEVTRIRAEMTKIMQKQGFKGTIIEYFDSLTQQPRFHLNSTSALLQEYKNMIFKRVYPQLPRAFKNIPNLKVDVEESPTDGISGEYFVGTADGSRPGVFRVNLKRPNETNTFSMMSLALHETVPGHHLQAIYALKARLPGFQTNIAYENYFAIPFNFPFYTAYTEGWALYAESLGEYLGIYKDDYELMGRYSEEILRACRLVVDTGLHYFGWSRDRAIQYMLDNTLSARSEVIIEIDRYITWPGQACAYKIGELTLKKLREKARTTLGSKFDIRVFHSVILDNGPVSLGLLEKIVNDWIQAESGAKPTLGSGHVGFPG